MTLTSTQVTRQSPALHPFSPHTGALPTVLANMIWRTLADHFGISNISKAEFVYFQTREFCLDYPIINASGAAAVFARIGQQQADGTWAECWTLSVLPESNSPQAREAAERVNAALRLIQARAGFR